MRSLINFFNLPNTAAATMLCLLLNTWICCEVSSCRRLKSVR